jgi:ubiquinone/menaquinone biosynthesis C-methylase UbiE
MAHDLTSRAGWHSLRSRLFIVLTSGFAEQSFLGSPLLPPLIRSVPERWRRSFVLRLLGMSPHYFTEQFSNRYPRDLPRETVLEEELRRNVESRRLLAKDVVAPFLRPDMTVLDFGCGVGILASEMARHCRHVIGVDISGGALASGKVLFDRDNLSFELISRNQIRGVADASVDLVTAIAVIQHMDDAVLRTTLGEFRRVLKPGGIALCHVPLTQDQQATPQAPQHQPRQNPLARLLQRRFGLLMLYRERSEFVRTAEDNGFAVGQDFIIGNRSSIQDDIANQHMFVLTKRAA